MSSNCPSNQVWCQDFQALKICRLNKNKTPAKHRDIFRDTLIEKKVWRRRGSNPRPSGWETQKKIEH